MDSKIFILCIILFFTGTCSAYSQETLNKTDAKGMKQGHWIKKYPNNAVMYDGYFRDNHPVGEFKRYYETGILRSVLIYSADGKEAKAALYHPNGNLASKGLYRNQLKEGKWQFFSSVNNGYLIAEESYSANQKHGPSLKFYPDSSVAEKLYWVKGVKHGEWIQYYQNGNKWIKSGYVNGKLNGKFEVWFEDGRLQYSGNYRMDARDGTWHIYNKDGSVRYKIEYRNGFTDQRQVDIDQSDFLDSLEINSERIPEPGNTGQVW